MKLSKWIVVLLAFSAMGLYSCSPPAEGGGDWYYANVSPLVITSAGYSGGAGPWFFGTDIMGLVMQITMRNTSGTPKVIDFNFASADGLGDVVNITLQPGEYYNAMHLVRVNVYSSSDRLHVKLGTDLTGIVIDAGGTPGIGVLCQYYIK